MGSDKVDELKDSESKKEQITNEIAKLEQEKAEQEIKGNEITVLENEIKFKEAALRLIETEVPI